MITNKTAVIGFYVDSWIVSQGKGKVKAYIYNKTNDYGRILLTLVDYLTRY